MNYKPKYLIIFIFFLLISLLSIAQTSKQLSDISNSNLTWNTPSENSFGSMPLGNGDIGLNVWVGKDGDLQFYISKVDAFDSGHMLPKLGKVRIKMSPALSANQFRQTLNLVDASILVDCGDVHFRIWVDANQPVIRVEGKSGTQRIVTISMESLRPLNNASGMLPQSGTIGLNFMDQENRLAWCYRNQSSKWQENFKSQNTPGMVAKTKDPILHRTSGCLLYAAGFIRADDTTLKSSARTNTLDCTIKVESSQPEDLNEWLTQISKPGKSDWNAHCAYWQSFWNRSYINITSGGEGKFNLDQCRFTQFPQGSKAYE